MIRVLSEERYLRNDLERWLVLWCRVAHDDITWPRHGRYQCRTCGRSFAVPWMEHEIAVARHQEIPLEAALGHVKAA